MACEAEGYGKPQVHMRVHLSNLTLTISCVKQIVTNGYCRQGPCVSLSTRNKVASGSTWQDPGSRPPTIHYLYGAPIGCSFLTLSFHPTRSLRPLNDTLIPISIPSLAQHALFCVGFVDHGVDSPGSTHASSRAYCCGRRPTSPWSTCLASWPPSLEARCRCRAPCLEERR